MTNADKFKSLFGLYATELWAMPEKDFLKWLNSEAMNCSEFPNNSDTISRQAAIDAVMECYDNDELFEAYEQKLNELPAIQPEIIRCKDCKHWIPYDWMFSEVWRSKNMADYPEDEIGCNWCDMAMKADDYCSRAERREVTT